MDQNEEDLCFSTNERVCPILLDFGTFNWGIDFDFDLSGEQDSVYTANKVTDYRLWLQILGPM